MAQFNFCEKGTDLFIATADDFYATLNGDWDLQDGAHTLGKDANGDDQRDPVLELNGALYVVTRVASSARGGRDKSGPGG